MSMRPADEVLNQQRFAVEARRQEQTVSIAFPTFGQAAGTAHRAQPFEDFIPICFWLAAFQVPPRGIDEPGFVFQIETAAQRVQPFKEHCARIGFLFKYYELFAGLRQFLHQRAARRVRRLPAFYAIGIKAREPAFRRAAIRAVRILLVAVKVRPHRAAAGQFFNRWSVALDFGKRRARRQAELPGEDVENAGETNERSVFSDAAAGKFAEVKLALLLARRHDGDLTTKKSDEATKTHKRPKNVDQGCKSFCASCAFSWLTLSM